MFDDNAIAVFLKKLSRLKRKQWWLLGLFASGCVGVVGGFLWLITAVNHPLQHASPQAQAEEATWATPAREPQLGVIHVDVSGAVNRPGLYQLESGNRVAQALERAGGLTPEADPVFVLQQLNLAQRLEDEQKLYIPFQDNPAESFPLTVAGAGTGEAGQGLVSLNHTTQAQLETLPDIGEKRAQDIIENRPFAQLDELLSKEIVSEALFSKIKGLIEL